MVVKALSMSLYPCSRYPGPLYLVVLKKCAEVRSPIILLNAREKTKSESSPPTTITGSASNTKQKLYISKSLQSHHSDFCPQVFISFGKRSIFSSQGIRN